MRVPSPARINCISLVVCFSCLILNSAAQETKPAESINKAGAAVTGPTPAAESTQSIRLGTGDLLDVSVYNVPELATKTRVGGNGDVYLPLVDYVHVAGLTIDEAQEVIEKRLADGFVNNPHVTIFVNEYASQNATILGEVLKPGQYAVLGEPRLFDVISSAGGFTERAARRVTITHRGSDDRPVSLQLARNVNDDPSKNIEIFPGDTVVVQRADVVYVVGDVGRPSGFLMDSDNLTVLKAIALAGGTNRTAKLSDARIIRKGPQGMQETRLELNKMLRAKAPDFPMQADDILFVPTNGGKIAAGHVAQAALQAAMAVSVVALVP
jgi:polysaccharide biosynthesis/export protein